MLQNVLWYLYYLSTDLSAQELLEKYGDPTLVDDLISRKTEAKLFQADPNFPDKEDQVESKPDKFIDFMFYLQDLRVYLCWAENVQEDADSRLKSIATTSSGALDNASAASSWQWGTYIDTRYRNHETFIRSKTDLETIVLQTCFNPIWMIILRLQVMSWISANYAAGILVCCRWQACRGKERPRALDPSYQAEAEAKANTKG